MTLQPIATHQLMKRVFPAESMSVTIWGSRGGVPVFGEEFKRYGGATSCVEITLQGGAAATPKQIIVDCGTGLARLSQARPLQPDPLILQTHLHWDNVQGFPFCRDLFNARSRLELWAAPREGKRPTQVFDRVVRESMAVRSLQALPATLYIRDLPEQGAETLGHLELSWIELPHGASGNTAWRLSWRNRSVVITGDTEVGAGGLERLARFAANADLLIMDAQYMPEDAIAYQGLGHSCVDEAVQVALKARARHLILTHHDPSHTDARLDHKLTVAHQLARGRVLVDNAADGMSFTLKTHPSWCRVYA